MPYRVENIVRKGEIACYKQFLRSSQCFPQLCIFSALNAVLCGNGLKTNLIVINLVSTQVFNMYAERCWF